MVTARVSPSGPVIEGSTVDLVCEATAWDLPTSYSWTGPSGQDVSLSDTDGTISVTISASGDYGTYICAATNEFGMRNATVEVIQAGRCVFNFRERIASVSCFASEASLLYVTSFENHGNIYCMCLCKRCVENE